MSSSLRAAIHLGQIYAENMAVFKNMHVEEIQNLFSITQRLVLENSEEVLNVKAIDSSDPSWMRTKISHLPVVNWAKAKVHVYADYVSRLWKKSASCTGSREVERAADRFSVNSFDSGIIRSCWRTKRGRVECSPRTYFIGNDSEDS